MGEMRSFTKKIINIIWTTELDCVWGYIQHTRKNKHGENFQDRHSELVYTYLYGISNYSTLFYEQNTVKILPDNSFFFLASFPQWCSVRFSCCCSPFLSVESIVRSRRFVSKSSLILSSHPFFQRPRYRLPPGSYWRAVFATEFSALLLTCPYYLRRFSPIVFLRQTIAKERIYFDVRGNPANYTLFIKI